MARRNNTATTTTTTTADEHSNYNYYNNNNTITGTTTTTTTGSDSGCRQRLHCLATPTATPITTGTTTILTTTRGTTITNTTTNNTNTNTTTITNAATMVLVLWCYQALILSTCCLYKTQAKQIPFPDNNDVAVGIDTKDLYEDLGIPGFPIIATTPASKDFIIEDAADDVQSIFRTIRTGLQPLNLSDIYVPPPFTDGYNDDNDDEFETGNGVIKYDKDDDDHNGEYKEQDLAEESDIFKTTVNQTEHHGRYRRSTRHKRHRTYLAAKVEVCVVVDYNLYKTFYKRSGEDDTKARAAIEKYYAAIIAMVNERYKEINEPTLSIKIVFSGAWVAQSIVEASFVEYHQQLKNNDVVIVAAKALKTITEWLPQNRQKEGFRKACPNYDHVMFFTGHSLVNTKGTILKGLAFVGDICDQAKSVSLIHDKGIYQSAGVAAHELGHGLGAYHDGEKENRDCPGDHNYVMSPTEHNGEKIRLNYMYLSKCSVRQIKALLKTPSADCIFDKPRKMIDYDLKSDPPGRRYSANQQCKMIYGKNSGICNQERLLDEMCVSLWCQDPQRTDTCRSMVGVKSIPGTRCSNGKMCWRGMCVNEFYRNTKQFCIHRKNCQGPDLNKKYCTKIIKLNPYACRRKAVVTYCCETCNRCHKRNKRRRRRRRRRSNRP